MASGAHPTLQQSLLYAHRAILCFPGCVHIVNAVRSCAQEPTGGLPNLHNAQVECSHGTIHLPAFDSRPSTPCVQVTQVSMIGYTGGGTAATAAEAKVLARRRRRRKAAEKLAVAADVGTRACVSDG